MACGRDGGSRTGTTLELKRRPTSFDDSSSAFFHPRKRRPHWQGRRSLWAGIERAQQIAGACVARTHRRQSEHFLDKLRERSEVTFAVKHVSAFCKRTYDDQRYSYPVSGRVHLPRRHMIVPPPVVIPAHKNHGVRRIGT